MGVEYNERDFDLKKKSRYEWKELRKKREELEGRRHEKNEESCCFTQKNEVMWLLLCANSENGVLG